MIRSLFLRKERIESRAEYKYALLRGQLGLLLGTICFVYVFIDILNGVLIYIPWYLGGIILSVLVIILNRQRRYMSSSILLLVTANMLVFLIASLEDSQGGAFFYFMATSATSLVVLRPINKTLGLVFVGVSIMLAGIAFFADVPLPAPPSDENYEKISFTINFLLGLLSSVLILHFVMTRNQESELSLIGNQDVLENLTKELEKSKNRFALAVEGTKAGIYEWEFSTSRLYMSARFKDLLGFGPGEVLDMSYDVLRTMIHQEDQENAAIMVNRAIGLGISFQYEARIRLKNGDFRWFLVSGIVDKKIGAEQLAVGSIIDIHDRKQAEQQLWYKNQELQKTNEELDKFVYRASHDMRAPLATLLGLLNLAKLTSAKSEIENYHAKMFNRIQAMDGFIKEVTDYSRNSRLEVKPVKVNLKAIIGEVIESFDFLINEADLSFKIEIDPSFELVTDKERLKVVLNNLVSNAIKYHDTSKTKRFVKIHAFQKNSHCWIRIVDNGIGIGSEFKDKIFDMFFRASERSDGSGLGLYIVKETVLRLNGTISCQSEEGLGSTFEVQLPALR